MRVHYTIEYKEYKPYEHQTTVEGNYNDTSNGDWYFAPKISSFFPFEASICLIWTPSKEFKIKPDWTFSVSSFSFQMIPNYIHTKEP